MGHYECYECDILVLNDGEGRLFLFDNFQIEHDVVVRTCWRVVDASCVWVVLSHLQQADVPPLLWSACL